MSKYEVSYISKDNQTYLISLDAMDVNNAIKKGYQRIIDKHWDIYEYKFNSIKEI